MFTYFVIAIQVLGFQFIAAQEKGAATQENFAQYGDYDSRFIGGSSSVVRWYIFLPFRTSQKMCLFVYMYVVGSWNDKTRLSCPTPALKA